MRYILGGFFLLVSLILEGRAVSLLIEERLSGSEVPLIIFLHLASSASLALGLAWKLKKEGGYLNWLLLGTTLALAIPVGGLLGVLLIFFLRSKLPPEAVSNLCDEYKKYMSCSIRGERPPGKIVNLPEFVRQGTEIEPVVQWLRDKDARRRVGAARILGRLGDKSSLERLHGLVKDSYAAVRSEAAAHISRGHEEFTANIFQAQKEVASHPESGEAHRILANISLEYCESGLLDTRAKITYLDLAEAEYLKSLTLEVEQVEVYNNLGRISIIKQDFLEGRERFEKALSCDADNLRALFGTAQCHYELGEYEKVSLICNRIREKHPQPDRFLDIISFWTEKPEKSKKTSQTTEDT